MTPVQPRTYRHFKGSLYEVIGIATEANTEAALVIYKAAEGNDRIFARPIENFTAIVNRDGKDRPRFELLRLSPSPQPPPRREHQRDDGRASGASVR